jgi:hypothetical protein
VASSIFKFSCLALQVPQSATSGSAVWNFWLRCLELQVPLFGTSGSAGQHPQVSLNLYLLDFTGEYIPSGFDLSLFSGLSRSDDFPNFHWAVSSGFACHTVFRFIEQCLQIFTGQYLQVSVPSVFIISSSVSHLKVLSSEF